MKTKFFSFWDPKAGDNEKFEIDVEFANILEPPLLTRLVDHVVDFALARTVAERRVVAQAAADKSGISPGQSARILATFTFLARTMLPGQDAADDEPHDLADDMVELKIIKPEKSQDTVEWLEALRAVSHSQLHRAVRLYDSALSTIPRIQASQIVIDIRAVFDHTFDPLKDNLDSYESSCIGVEPVSYTHLTLPTSDLV